MIATGNLRAFPTIGQVSNFPAATAARMVIGSSRAHLAMFQPICRKAAARDDLSAGRPGRDVFGAFGLRSAPSPGRGRSSLGAIALTTTLQQRISVPILELAKVAGSVSERPDYSVRAVKHGNDEIGQLTDAFNRMLMRIGESNAALAASEERLRLALEGHAPDMGLEPPDRTNHLGRLHVSALRRTKQEFDGTIESFLRNRSSRRSRPLCSVLRAQRSKGKRPIDVDFRMVDRDGTIRHMASRGRVFTTRTAIRCE